MGWLTRSEGRLRRQNKLLSTLKPPLHCREIKTTLVLFQAHCVYSCCREVAGNTWVQTRLSLQRFATCFHVVGAAVDGRQCITGENIQGALSQSHQRQARGRDGEARSDHLSGNHRCRCGRDPRAVVFDREQRFSELSLQN